MIRIIIAFFVVSLPFVSFDKPFFPEDTWAAESGAWTPAERSAFFEEWYGGQLAAMGELPIWPDADADQSSRTIRLLFLPTFHNGAAMRLEVGEGKSTQFVFKRLNGAGGYSPGELVISDSGVLSEQDRLTLETLLDQIQPFSANTPSTLAPGCFDGTTVVLEISEGSSYAALSRHECNLPKGHPIRELVVLLNKISDNRLFDQPDLFEAISP